MVVMAVRVLIRRTCELLDVADEVVAVNIMLCTTGVVDLAPVAANTGVDYPEPGHYELCCYLTSAMASTGAGHAECGRNFAESF